MTDKKLPNHLAIILDGNGRWAKRRNLPRLMGHRAGFRKLDNIARLVLNRGIRYFSVYAFSTENWNRPEMEVTGLMSIFSFYIHMLRHKANTSCVDVNTSIAFDNLCITCYDFYPCFHRCIRHRFYNSSKDGNISPLL